MAWVGGRTIEPSDYRYGTRISYQWAPHWYGRDVTRQSAYVCCSGRRRYIITVQQVNTTDGRTYTRRSLTAAFEHVTFGISTRGQTIRSVYCLFLIVTDVFYTDFPKDNNKLRTRHVTYLLLHHIKHRNTISSTDIHVCYCYDTAPSL